MQQLRMATAGQRWSAAELDSRRHGDNFVSAMSGAMFACLRLCMIMLALALVIAAAEADRSLSADLPGLGATRHEAETVSRELVGAVAHYANQALASEGSPTRYVTGKCWRTQTDHRWDGTTGDLFDCGMGAVDGKTELCAAVAVQYLPTTKVWQAIESRKIPCREGTN